MANPAFPNEYTLRTVADSASKPCFVCHRAAAKVLITSDSKVSTAVRRAAMFHASSQFYHN